MVTLLETLFPGLAKGGYRTTSPTNADYNCIAWAAGNTYGWWWPGRDASREYRPPGVPRERTLDAFAAAFASLGYTACESESPEAGYEKIAIFADVDGRPTHAARQLPGGRWTSKLGIMEDIEHGLHDLEGATYGAAALIMKRAAPQAATRQDRQ